MPNKVRKLLEALSNPRYWRGLRHGIAPTIEHKLALEGLNVRTVLDVGANRGQFSLLARCLYPAATIYAFEPLQCPAERFRALFADQATVHLFQVGIGEALADAKMFIANDHQASSSILKAHKQSQIFGSRETGEETVRIGRLTDFLSLDHISPPCLLKIDVQGYELQVINGCREALPLIDYLYVECCYAELYARQALAHEILTRLGEFGFALRGTFNQHHDPKEGPVIADFLFQSLRSMAAARAAAALPPLRQERAKHAQERRS
jgi:FkbM family methyltransferase